MRTARFRCDHCGWEGDRDACTVHPREGDGVCPDCWAEGYETRPREVLGTLIEVLADHEPSPRVPKAVIDWTDEEWETNARVSRFRALHEAAPVTFDSGIEGRRQFGFDFMREEFKVAPRKAPKGRSKAR